MTRVKFIPIMIAAILGLALQFQASRADAYTAYPTYMQACSCNVNLWSFVGLQPGDTISSPNGNYLTLQIQGNLVLYDFYGNFLWQAPNSYGYISDYMQFQDGDMLVEQQYMGNPPVRYLIAIHMALEFISLSRMTVTS